MSLSEQQFIDYRAQLSCGFAQLDDTFEACVSDAFARLSNSGVNHYLAGAKLICMIGRGVEPVQVYLEEMPEVAQKLGEETLSMVSQAVWQMSRSPNGNSIPPFLQSIASAARRLGSLELFQRYLELIHDLQERTTGSIHGFHTTIPSPGSPELLKQIPYLLSQLSLDGLHNWIDYGIRNYGDNPDRQKDFFSLQSADSKAMLQYERHGTLFYRSERLLDLYMRAIWPTAEGEERPFYIPYSLGWDELRKPRPYFDKLGLRIPDVFDDLETPSGHVISGIDRYRAVLAHMAAHKRWSGKIVVDNLSPFQREAVEWLEDSRVEYLAMQAYPGLRRLWLSQHPKPIEGDCQEESESCIRYRLAMLSYAILDADHGYQNSDVLEWVEKFHALMAQGEASTQEISMLAVGFIARTRRQSDQLPKVYFKNTEVDYRDDNRHLWIFIEQSDDEEIFEDLERKAPEEDAEEYALPPRHYPEWDYHSKSYRPDWVSLYETLHPQGDASKIDDLLAKHSSLAKRMKQILELLKPQRYVRIRYQEEGSELDLDVAIRSLIDFKSGAQPDTRINMSHKHDGRDISVMLLLDLSASLAETPEGSTQTILELSQEAVALLAWAIEMLGDQFAIAGFSSNTRHEVRYQHIKGYSEAWDEEPKARLAAMEAGFSTRMGAAMRHAAHYLSAQKGEKKLLLVLTDGEPADIDVGDPKLLIQDAHKAVQELDQDGIYTYCINLDPHADEYVQDIFGHQYTVIDDVASLPEKLPQLFMALTK